MNIMKHKKIIIFFIGIILIILPISPISSQPVIIEKPDFLLCLIFGWIILDPKKSSISILILLSFFADILWYRPLGLWPLLILLGSLSIKLILTKIRNGRNRKDNEYNSNEENNNFLMLNNIHRRYLYILLQSLKHNFYTVFFWYLLISYFLYNFASLRWYFMFSIYQYS